MATRRGVYLDDSMGRYALYGDPGLLSSTWIFLSVTERRDWMLGVVPYPGKYFVKECFQQSLL
jgi:hypothetical protein